MAQTGFTPIQLYSSSTTGNTPAAADLLNSSGGSELAINIFDGKLFYKDSSGNVQVIGWKVVPVSAGGTGQTSYTDGQLLIGNTTGNTLTKATLTAGSGVTITNGAGAITINATGTGGTVTSVAALTLGTTGTDLSSTVANGTTTPVITLNVPTASAANRGALSSTDWSTFNGKQAALVSGTNIKTVSGVSLLGSGDVGTIGTGYGGTGLTSFTNKGVVYASSTSALATGSALVFDGTKLGVGVASPTYIVDVSQSLNGDAGPRITNSNAGAATIANFTATNGTSFSWFGQAGTAYGGYAQIRANGSGIYANGAGGIGFSADNAAGIITFGTGSSATEAMRIHASKGVSIGNTTDPGATNLSVTGNVTSGSLTALTAQAGLINSSEGVTGLIANGATATLCTLTQAGSYIITARQDGAGNGGIRAFAFVAQGSASNGTTSLAAASCTISSGAGFVVNITNNAGGSATFRWSFTRLSQ